MDSVTVLVVIALVAAVLAAVGQLASSRAGQASLRKKEQELRTARAQEEERAKEAQTQREDARKEELAVLEGAQKRMALAQENINRAQHDFRATHDQLIASILNLAKEGCDEQFRQRFGITRPPKAGSPEADEEVQSYLREHYAELRDSALARMAGEFVEREVDRRLAIAQEAEGACGESSRQNGETPKEEAPEEGEAPTPEKSAPAAGEAPASKEPAPAEPIDDTGDEADEDEADGLTATPADDANDKAAEAAGTASSKEDAAGNDEDAGGAEAAPDEADPDEARATLRNQVREEFDFESLKTYMLAAISARFDGNGKPLGDLPWPAYTTISTRGFGELCLTEGAPGYAQDAYRDFAWKMFHTGKRAEKPQRGEYSWPQSHELGDYVLDTALETPVGRFTATGPNGALPLHVRNRCAWVHHDLNHQGALLKPDGRESLLVNLEGLHKGDILNLAFDEASALSLEEAETTRLFLNAVGAAGDVAVGLSVSNPEAANPGDAPFELAERTQRGLLFRMTADARRHDDDTFPQFLEIHLCWCAPPSPKPEKVVRHLAR